MAVQTHLHQGFDDGKHGARNEWGFDCLTSMQSSQKSWIYMILVAGLPRVAGAFLLPNAFGDAYSYIKDIGILSRKITAGSLSLTDLYGFWLPLYQFLSAIVVAVVGHQFYVAKVVSALFGIGICLLVYAISYRLTENRGASVLTFALIALNPLHIFNSASAMTDVPNAFLVLASVYFAVERRWLASAILGALAGLTRVDSWMLLALIPGLQYLFDRRVSITGLGILCLPPLFWFYVSWKATGDWLACFVMRKQYMDALFVANPSLAGFSFYGVARDAGALLLSTDLAVLTACFASVWLIFNRIRESREEYRSDALRPVLTVQTVFFAFVGFLFLAYATHKQPIIFPRYGLILFTLGIPLLPWAYLSITRARPALKRPLLVMISAVCIASACIQTAYAVGYINRVAVSRAIADSLRYEMQRETGSVHVFNDDGEVLALSKLPDETFLGSSVAPGDINGFLDFLSANNVRYLVFDGREQSTPVRLFPGLGDGKGNATFHPIAHSSSSFLPADIWLYCIEQTQH